MVPQQRDEFEMVDQQDAVDALAYYLASCLMKMPEAQAMQPRQLQDALTVAMRVGGWVGAPPCLPACCVSVERCGALVVPAPHGEHYRACSLVALFARRCTPRATPPQPPLLHAGARLAAPPSLPPDPDVLPLPPSPSLPPCTHTHARTQSLRRSKVKRLCEWGRYVYRWSAFTYSAVQMYQNPWLIQALLTALWTFSKVARIAIRASGYL